MGGTFVTAMSKLVKNYYQESQYRWYHIFHVSNLIKNDCTEFSTTGDCSIRPCLENSWLINFEFQFLIVGLLILICFLKWQNIAVGIIFFLLLVNTSMLIIFATVEDVSAAHNIRNIFPKIQAYYWNNFQIVSILIKLTFGTSKGLFKIFFSKKCFLAV